MKKTILLITALILIFSLCRTGDSYAVSDKKLAKLAKKAGGTITEAQESLTRWKTADLIVPPEAEKILEKARKAHKAGSYKEARKLAEESLKTSSDKGAWKLAQKTKEIITQAQGYINLWEKEDLTPPPQAKEILKKAKAAYQSYNNEEACQLASQSLKITTDEGLKKEARKARGAITEAEASITRCESAGYTVPQAKEILRKARQANEACNYKEARKLAKNSLEVSSKKKIAGPAEIKPKKVEKTIKKVEKKISKWESEIQIPIPQAKKFIEEANTFYQSGNYKEARNLAGKAYNSWQHAVMAERYIKGMEAHATKWESAGYDVPLTKKILREARQAQKDGEQEKAHHLGATAVIVLKREVAGSFEPKIEFQINPQHGLTKYKKIVVLKIGDAPQTLGSGEIVTNLVSHTLAKRKYQIVQNKEEADAIISGSLTRYEAQESSYRLHSKAFIYKSRVESYFLATVELTLNMKDAKTNTTVWQVKGKQEMASKEIKPVAQSVINAILDQVPQSK